MKLNTETIGIYKNYASEVLRYQESVSQLITLCYLQRSFALWNSPCLVLLLKIKAYTKQ